MEELDIYQEDFLLEEAREKDYERKEEMEIVEYEE